jgi:hypothetical protein
LVLARPRLALPRLAGPSFSFSPLLLVHLQHSQPARYSHQQLQQHPVFDLWLACQWW